MTAPASSTTPPAPRPDTRAPLRIPPFRWYYAARLVNLLGTTMAPVALAFAVLDISDSPSALGQVLAAQSIPLVVFLLAGGVIADRFDRAILLRVTNVGAGLSQGAIAALILTDRAELWHLIVLAAFNGTLAAVSFPALASVVPTLVPREHLQPANVLLSMQRAGLAIIGPSVAAALVVAFGPGWALAIDAATWLVSAALLLRVHIPPRAPLADRGTDPGRPSFLAELREGWSVFTSHTWLWVIVLAFGALNAIHAGAWFTLGPSVAKDTIGERGWGFALSAEAIGVLVMTLVLSRLHLRRPLLAGMLGMTVFSVPLLVLGVDPVLPLLVLGAFAAGVGVEVFSLGWNLAMQENIEERLLSRAYSYDALGSFVAIPVGQLTFGPLAEAFGASRVITIAAVAYVVIALSTLLSRSVRRLERVAVMPTSEPVSGSR
ncbi:MFS transporter [Nocardioides bigeumensis]|uniref:MFS transporter n=1 Tax=Nocardioides bigeumensis TaxID=433657 RepID=A0ABP5K3U9_9ACTN